jgi:hypothetical protein
MPDPSKKKWFRPILRIFVRPKPDEMVIPDSKQSHLDSTLPASLGGTCHTKPDSGCPCPDDKRTSPPPKS